MAQPCESSYLLETHVGRVPPEKYSNQSHDMIHLGFLSCSVCNSKQLLRFERAFSQPEVVKVVGSVFKRFWERTGALERAYLAVLATLFGNLPDSYPDMSFLTNIYCCIEIPIEHRYDEDLWSPLLYLNRRRNKYFDLSRRITHLWDS